MKDRIGKTISIKEALNIYFNHLNRTKDENILGESKNKAQKDSFRDND